MYGGLRAKFRKPTVATREGISIESLPVNAVRRSTFNAVHCESDLDTEKNGKLNCQGNLCGKEGLRKPACFRPIWLQLPFWNASSCSIQ